MVHPRLLKLFALVLQNQAYSNGRLTPELLEQLGLLLTNYSRLWSEEQERLAQAQQQKESLYAFKSHGEEVKTDDELLAEIVKQNFPAYHQVYMIQLL